MEFAMSRIGCFYIPIKVFKDSRGSFTELYRKTAYEGLPEFAQDNVSISEPNVVRGLHFQSRQPQGKLVRVLEGAAIDVAVDLRVGSPTYGMLEQFDLRPDHYAVFIPPGYAHGFWALSRIVFHYKCTQEFDAKSDGGINPLDPALECPWQGQEGLIVSSKDQDLPKLADLKSPFSASNHL